jgi:hypothetical protein
VTERITQGLSAVWSLILLRPPIRSLCLDIALQVIVFSTLQEFLTISAWTEDISFVYLQLTRSNLIRLICAGFSVQFTNLMKCERKLFDWYLADVHVHCIRNLKQLTCECSWKALIMVGPFFCKPCLLILYFYIRLPTNSIL